MGQTAGFAAGSWIARQPPNFAYRSSQKSISIVTCLCSGFKQVPSVDLTFTDPSPKSDEKLKKHDEVTIYLRVSMFLKPDPGHILVPIVQVW
jgi:hypothetical protein